MPRTSSDSLAENLVAIVAIVAFFSFAAYVLWLLAGLFGGVLSLTVGQALIVLLAFAAGWWARGRSGQP